MKALVLLHGWGMSRTVFDALGDRLEGRYDVRCIALPGYDGPSCEPYELACMAQRVAAAAPARCFVAGWSLGGQVALAWARAEAQQVERMVLIGTTPCFARRADWHPALEACVLQEFAAALDRDAAGTLKRFASLQAQGDGAVKRVAATLRACVYGSAGDGVAADGTLEKGLEVLMETDLRPVLDKIESAALVIHGRNDRLVPLAAAEYLATKLHNGRLAVVDGAAHAPFVSDPGTVADLMTGFFDGR